MKKAACVLLAVALISCKHKHNDNYLKNCCEQGTYIEKIISGDTIRAYSLLTPNGDGCNDFFLITINGERSNFPSQVALQVKNGWGTIYKTEDYRNGWQGKVRDAVYRFTVTYKEESFDGYMGIILGDPPICIDCAITTPDKNDPVLINCH
jgi:hypothetical protein